MSHRIRFTTCESTLGHILIAVGKNGICAISLGGDPADPMADLRARFPEAALIGDDRTLQKVRVGAGS